MDQFIQEVEEDLKRDRHLELWRKYGVWATAAGLLLVIAVAAYQGWRNYQRDQQQLYGQSYAQALALLAKGKDAEARAEFGKLAGEAVSGYAELALLQRAALLAKGGDGAGAAALYRQLADDTSADELFRDLAVILTALITTDNADPRDLTARLAPLTAPGNPWRYSALEVTALLAQRQGDQARAKEIYQSLADDAKAPQGMRARAAEMLAVMESPGR